MRVHGLRGFAACGFKMGLNRSALNPLKGEIETPTRNPKSRRAPSAQCTRQSAHPRELLGIRGGGGGGFTGLGFKRFEVKGSGSRALGFQVSGGGFGASAPWFRVEGFAPGLSLKRVGLATSQRVDSP